jgi:site-specific DNA recombinase
MARPRGSKMQHAQRERLATGAGKLLDYIRVSTAEQSHKGRSLAGQRTRLQEVAAREGFELVRVIEEVVSGAQERDGLAEAQARILAGEAQGLIFLKVDRVGRSMVHLLKVVNWAVANRVDLLSADEGWQVREGEQVDKMLPFRLAMAEVELERIREGLKAARAKGVRLGRPAEHVGEIAQLATQLRRQGLTLREVAEELNRRGYRNRRGTELLPMTVYNMVNREDPAANPEGGYRGKVASAAT